MQLKNRINKLERKQPQDSSLKFLFVTLVTPGSMETRICKASILGHGIELFSKDDETDGEFCQRVYGAYAKTKGLQACEPKDMSDEDLQILIASGCPKLALTLHDHNELSDEDLRTALEMTSKEQGQ